MRPSQDNVIHHHHHQHQDRLEQWRKRNKISSEPDLFDDTANTHTLCSSYGIFDFVGGGGGGGMNICVCMEGATIARQKRDLSFACMFCILNRQ